MTFVVRKTHGAFGQRAERLRQHGRAKRCDDDDESRAHFESEIGACGVRTSLKGRDVLRSTGERWISG